MISRKRKEPYTVVLNHIRTKLRFALLRNTLEAIRGFRGRHSDKDVKELMETDIGLIPMVATYEV